MCRLEWASRHGANTSGEGQPAAGGKPGTVDAWLLRRLLTHDVQFALPAPRRGLNAPAFFSLFEAVIGARAAPLPRPSALGLCSP